MKKIFLFLIIGFVSGLLCQIQKPQVDISFIITDDSTGIATLQLGLDPLATDGIDAAFGEEEYPPYPPTGVFDARFIGEDIGLVNQLGLGVHKDFRPGSKTFVGLKYHEMRFQPGKGKVIVVKWNIPQGVSAQLKDLFGGAVVNINMTGIGSYTVTNPSGINKLLLDMNYSGTVINVKDEIKLNDFYLAQNFPNPFNPSTMINYQLPVNTNVSLIVYDLFGKEIETLINKPQNIGNYSLDFSASNYSSGVYFYILKTDKFISVKKMMIVK